MITVVENGFMFYQEIIENGNAFHSLLTQQNYIFVSSRQSTSEDSIEKRENDLKLWENHLKQKEERLKGKMKKNIN